MAFSCFHTDKRSTNQKQVRNFSIYKKKSHDGDEAKKPYIPKFFDFDITYFNKDNYLILNDTNGRVIIYVTPLIRIYLNNLKSYIDKHDSLARTIKERIDSNSRLLIKNSCENSKVIKIKNKEYVLINANFIVLESGLIRIMNDFHYKEHKLL